MMNSNGPISVINSIEVPVGHEQIAIETRDAYVAYFKTRPGFVSSTFYQTVGKDNAFQFVNIVVWDSMESFNAVVNEGFQNAEGLNSDGMKVLGKGFPEPIKVFPGQFATIRQD